MAKLGYMTDRAYNDIKMLRNSSIGKVEKSYDHFLTSDEEDSEAFTIGSAFHTLLLEGKDKFDATYGIVPEGTTRASNAGKAVYASIEEKNQVPLKESAYKNIQSMVKAVLAHPIAVEILKTGSNEGVYTGKILGEDFKVKIDTVSRGYIFDVKSTSDASASEFVRSIEKFNYHRQGAVYKEIVNQNGVEVKGFGLIAVEKTAPFGVQVFLLNDEDLKIGLSQAERLVKKIKRHRDNPSLYSGYSDRITPISIRQWKIDEEINESAKEEEQ